MIPANKRNRRRRKPNTDGMRSGFESKVAKALNELGVPFEYESERIKYTQPATTKNYIPDFIIKDSFIIEAKGRLTAQDRKKMILVIRQNPDKDIRILFQRDNYLRKGSKTRYTDWCAKHGIKCAVSSTGTVPYDWIGGLSPPARRTEVAKPKPPTKRTKRRTTP